ncbi:hypothetical protein WMF31_15450 [Sorangium sp. So ce1036]|uniref:hypothetical protein n=1 Tax=Sorangium sp. So ce1036 TaxID=3133328 RepID=UPI003F04F9DD
MSSLSTLQPLGQDDLYAFLAERVRPRLLDALEAAGPGQRLRVTTLPEPVMESVCVSLQGDPRWEARVLCAGDVDAEWKASATKLIELRNVLDRPLLVFLPPSRRTAAEDSLDIATFTELSLATIAEDLLVALFDELPEPLRKAVRDELLYLRAERLIANADEEVEYLLTVRKNGCTPAAAGGALHIFGLLPDFQLFERGNPRYWLTRNVNVCARLGDVTQPLQTRLRRLPVKPNTVQNPLFAFLRARHSDDIRAWAREIACDPAHRRLALDQWEFTDDGEAEDLRILLDPLGLPRQTEDNVLGAAQMPVLNVGDKSKDVLKVAFRSIPSPSQVPAWKTWRVQILSVAEGQVSVAWESNSYPKPAQGRLATIRRSIKAKDLQGLEEGTYYLKVDAYDAEGAQLTRPRRVDESDPNSRAENESEQFLVVRDTVDIEEPDVRAVFVTSLLEAWTLVAAKSLGAKQREAVPERAAIRGAWDVAVGAPPRGDVRFQLSGNAFTGYTIVVPAVLRRLELALLEHPDHLGRHEISFVDLRKLEDVEIKRHEVGGLGTSPEVIAFLEARRQVFRAIREHHFDATAKLEDNRSERSGLVETVDLAPHGELIERYAERYIALVEAAARPDLDPAIAAAMRAALALLDVVDLRWRSSPGDAGRAQVVAPVHPLRLLWHLGHTRMCHEAVGAWEDGSRHAPAWRAFLDQLRRDLYPMNLPMVLFNKRGRAFVEHAPLTPFWPLYLPDRVEEGVPIDAMAARDRVLRAMGIRDRTITVTTVDPSEIAGRLFDYIEQHPYVEQLCLNVFNPGDGRLIADVLRAVESMRVKSLGSDAPSLRYAIHLFGSSAHADSAADGLESLLDPERQVGEDDEFTLASSNHLLPKLVFARNSVAEFLSRSERYTAHVSLLLEQFAVLGRVGRIETLRRGSFVAGLVQEPETQAEPIGPHFGWVKGLRPLTRREPTRDEERMRAAVGAAQRVQASFALGKAATEDEAPVVALQLTPMDQALLKQVHEISDWVLTVDRSLGLDYFDSPSSAREAGYLLDFTPEYLQEDRQRLLLTTRSTLELESLIQPALAQYGLELCEDDVVVVLEALRSLSGHLALRLETGHAHAAEVVGLLLARWLLERTKLLEERLVVPLDAHRGWFADDARSDDGSTSRQRADLLLVGFTEPRTIRLDVVEVKLREELSGSARSQLYAEMRRQTQNTAERLRDRFALDLYPEPRADALLRAKELSGALSFYARRAQRYALLSEKQANAALAFLEHLDDGYELDLRTMGVIFEHRGQGVHDDEDEPGFRVARLGGDKAKQLLEHAVEQFARRSQRSSERRGRARASQPPPPASPAESEPPMDAELESFRSALSTRPLRAASAPPIPYAGRAAGDGRPVHARENVDPNLDRADRPPQPHTASPAEHAPGPTTATSTPAAPEAAGATAITAISPADAAAARSAAQEAERLPGADVLLGATAMTAQYGILGKSGSQRVGLDLMGCNTISLFGVQGFGKSYTLGAIAEMASAKLPGINSLPSPLATVIFHYHKSDAYEPEFTTAISPNQKQSEVDRLLRDYGARPTGLDDVLLLAPEAKVEQRRKEYPGITVEPIKFSSSELKNDGWKFLLGAYGNDALYLRQLNAILRRHREVLTLEKLREELRDADLSKAALRLAEDRLKLAEPYIDDARSLGDLLRPGRTVIVDLRDEWIEKDEALELFVVMMRIFAAQKLDGRDFNKLLVFDEAHKYISESELVAQVVETIREMRHHATSIVIASQDPLSVPRVVVELSTVLVLHRMTSPQWLKHLKTAITSLEGVSESHLSALAPGEALVWAQRSTDKRFSQRPQKITIRPRVTQHGGGTKTAVAGATVR